ncbi:MAG TPA: hypothetical protein VN033_14675 [Vulgatibacter sp.]|nr:hypothetical protein [Vulgatibacter sp.]
MRKGLRFAVYAALMSLPLAACDCSDPQVSERPGEVVAKPEFLSWGDVCDEAADVRVVRIENVGRAAMTVTLAIEGPDAAYFSIADEQKSFSIVGGDGVDVQVTHQSTGGERNKNHDANLVVTAGETEPFAVPLLAHVADVDPAPYLAFGCIDGLPLCADAGDEACCQTAKDESKSTTRNLSFGKTAIGETSVVRVHVTNQGCGDLRVDGIRMEKLAGDTCDSLLDEEGNPFEQVTAVGFEPFVLAGSTDPARYNSREIEFAFVPELQPCQLNRKVVLVTNDPNAPPDEEGKPNLTRASGTLSGEAVRGVLLINPPELVYGDVKMGETKTLTVEVRNPTLTPVTIDSIEITDYVVPQMNGRDQYTLLQVYRGKGTGDPIPATDIHLAESQLKEDSVEDRITVEIRYAPDRPGIHKAILRVNHAAAATKSTRGILTGASSPRLKVYPPGLTFGTANAAGCAPVGPPSEMTQCAQRNCMGAFACSVDGDCGFGNKCLDGLCAGDSYGVNVAICTPACGQQTKTVALCNEGIAPLDLGTLHFQGGEAGSPAPVDSQRDGSPEMFGISSNCSDTTLQPGECCNETLTYVDARQGGTNVATLVVPSSDAQATQPEWGGRPVPVSANTFLEGVTRPPVVPNLLTGPDFPRVGEWISFDASEAYAPFGDNLSFQWKLTRVEGASKYQTPIEIDPLDLGRGCPESIGHQCFQLSPDGKVFSIWPEHANFVYHVKVEVFGDLCDPQWSASVSDAIRVGATP